MAAVPVGYEAFHSRRRRGITLLCFLLASTMAMGITVYVDSYSIYKWNEYLDVGPIAIKVWGSGIEDKVDAIKNLPHVTKAVELQYSWGYVENRNATEYYQMDGKIYSPNSEYLTAFPESLKLEDGRLPENTSEIALEYRIAQFIQVKLGSFINYSYYGYEEPFNVTVVGLFEDVSSEENTDIFWDYDYYPWWIEIIAFVVPELLSPYDSMTEVHIDIDRSILTAFDASGSRATLSNLDESIRELDPAHNPPYSYSQYSVSDLLLYGITNYIYWIQAQRMTQLFRSGGIILLIIFVTFLAVRHNINERRFEANMLISRGAAESDINKIVNRELYGVTILSSLAGIGLGLLLSRVAMASNAFFQFDIMKMLTEPFLISLESLIMSVIVGVALPIATLILYRVVYSTKKTVEERGGRLAKLAKGLRVIRWDAILIVLSALLMITLYSGGETVQTNPILSLVLPIVPLALFLGMASLAIKIVRRSANRLSRALSRVVGDVAASVGIRRIGKEASSAGPAAMVLVLAISLAWTSAVIDSTLPYTKLIHAKFDIGADVTFQLSNNYASQWNNFTTNVTGHALFEQGTYVSSLRLYLSQGWGEEANFVGIVPEEYATIGYDYEGSRLNDSTIVTLLDDLVSNPSGAIITEDIAENYAVGPGDLLRGFTMEEESEILEFTILGVVQAIPELVAPEYGMPIYWYYGGMPVGASRIWVNSEYLETLVNIEEEANTYYCVRTTHGANGTKLAVDVLENGGNKIVQNDNWAAVSNEVENYVTQVAYQMDRALDTMLTMITVGMILGAFAIYAVEGVRERRREIALLRSMGAKRGLVTKAQGVEMLVLTLVSLLVLLIYGPLLIANSLMTTSTSYSENVWLTYIYPIQVFPVIPWTTILSVLMFFVVSVVVFIIAIAAFGSRVNLSAALNASWAEAGPYGGET